MKLKTLITSSAIILAISLTGCNSGNSNQNQTPSTENGINAQAFNNVAILNNPTVAQISDIANYKLNGSPYFTTVVLFAANIIGNSPNTPTLSYNQQMSDALNTPAGIAAIRSLQQQGVKVQLAYQGYGNDNAGWSCTMTTATIQNLAQELVSEISNNNLDGLMIDDEYSGCSGDVDSFYALVKAIKTNPSFSGKILSKALWEDSSFFTGATNVAPYLDQGYQMSYDGDVNSLIPYVTAGMSKPALGFGVWLNQNPLSSVKAISTAMTNAGYGGLMIYAPNTGFNSSSDAANYFTQMAQGEYGASAVVTYTN